MAVTHSICWAVMVLLQNQEPVVVKTSLSVHTVERGDMPVLEAARGMITSLQPARAAVTFAGGRSGPCEPGRKANIVVDPPRALPGKISKPLADGCELEISGPLPDGTVTGKQIEALVQVSELKNVVFFGRPASSSADSEAIVFVVEPGSAFARRVKVRYGRISGPLIQVIDGLAPGDRVIVTDMSRWKAYPRVRLE